MATAFTFTATRQAVLLGRRPFMSQQRNSKGHSRICVEAVIMARAAL